MDVTIPDGHLDARLDAFCAAATDGIDFDGVRVTATEDGYALVTPTESYRSLDEAALRERAREHAAHVTNWYFWERVVGGDGTARRAFLRWIDGWAENRTVSGHYAALRNGVERSWGELLITARLGATGDRTYELRHESDRDAAVADLEVLMDPFDAHTVATYDDRGRYRPLKSAPSLISGWVCSDLSPDELVDAIGYLYPASIENWHREREGCLDVTHFRETAERQTGMYDIVDELPIDALTDAVEACCVDSQCLKRRLWDEDDETPLAVERGAGEFPCREPCSLFLTAARTFVTLEREHPRTFEFTLTPSEMDGLVSILDAVATGRTDDVRDGDLQDPANRYRARYLRARRFSDSGHSTVRTNSEEQEP